MVVLKFVWFILFGLAYAAPEGGNEKRDNGINKKGLSLLNEDICGIAPLAKTYHYKLHFAPWLALLQYKTPSDKNDIVCSGALITSKYVLTSASCLNEFNSEKPIQVRLGDHNIFQEKYCIEDGCERGHEDFDVVKHIVHNDYTQSNGLNDIALVKLSKDVEFKDHIRPICLPISEELFNLTQRDNYFDVVGFEYDQYRSTYGLTRMGSSYHDDFANSTNQIFSNSRCFDSGDLLCSRIPLQMPGEKRVPAILVGIVSSDGCDQFESRTVSTNVVTYIPWISEKILE